MAIEVPDDNPILSTKCTSEYKHHDDHYNGHLCYEITQGHTWDMCQSTEEFINAHCPPAVFYRGWTKTTQAYSCCRRRLRDSDARFSCHLIPGKIQYYKV